MRGSRSGKIHQEQLERLVSRASLAAFIHSIDCKINCLKIVGGSFVNIAEPLPPTDGKTGMLWRDTKNHDNISLIATE